MVEILNNIVQYLRPCARAHACTHASMHPYIHTCTHVCAHTRGKGEEPRHDPRARIFPNKSAQQRGMAWRGRTATANI